LTDSRTRHIGDKLPIYTLTTGQNDVKPTETKLTPLLEDIHSG